MDKPMIGVVPLHDHKKESYWMLPGYMKGIEDAGGIPVMLPLTTDKDIIVILAKTFDGFLFTGGHDINPKLYGERIEPFCGEISNKRDDMEVLLFTHVLKLDKPSFGICRGLQLFNVLLGGTLYQDIQVQRGASDIEHSQKPPYSQPIHDVYIERNNLLHEILQTDSLKVNSYHHQAIKDLSSQLVPVAKAEDGLIEAVVMPDKKFTLAVQWHPEFSYKVDQHSIKLFGKFVQACKE